MFSVTEVAEFVRGTLSSLPSTLHLGQSMDVVKLQSIGRTVDCRLFTFPGEEPPQKKKKCRLGSQPKILRFPDTYTFSGRVAVPLTAPRTSVKARPFLVGCGTIFEKGLRGGGGSDFHNGVEFMQQVEIKCNVFHAPPS